MVPEAAMIRRASRTSRQAVTVESAMASSFSVPRRHRMMTCPLSAATTAWVMMPAAASPQREVIASEIA